VLTPLLKTKLYIPPPRPYFVSRPWLTEMLDQGLRPGHKLSLISTPAGYGKTTLLVEWIHNVIQNGVNAVWLSLDKGDNDPFRFWCYVLTALNKIPQLQQTDIGESALAMLQSHQPPPIDSVLIGLINEIARIPEPMVLVMDDLHLVIESVIHAQLTTLLEHLRSDTGGLHLVIATRRDPPWPMARLRAKGELLEIRTQDLRFTQDESAQFLTQAIGFELSPENISALDERTEGWIAGLQMAALSIKERQDLSRFVASFTGSHRFILDYLVEEVIDRQPPDIQEFLLKTSILERMSAPLCEVVVHAERKETLPAADTLREAAGPDYQAILTYLEQRNLFLTPLDDKRRWYRYHHLFADLLRNRLKKIYPGEVRDLHRRASAWYEDNNWVTEAVKHALEAEDTARVARLVEQNAFSMLDRGEMSTLLGWLEMIPVDIRRARPWMGLAHAWVLVYDGQLEGTEEELQRVEKALTVLGSVEQERAAGHISAIRAYAAWIRGDGEKAEYFARQALTQLPEEELTVRALTGTTLAGALMQCDDLDGASQLQGDAILRSQASGNTHVYMLSVSMFAFLLIQQGRMYEAEALCRQALASAAEQAGRRGGQSPAIAQVYAMLSAVRQARNELESAVSLAQKGLDLSKRWTQADTLTVNYVYLADALIAAGDLVGASDAVQGCKQLGYVSSWFDAIVGRQEATLMLAIGDIPAAVRWAEQRGMDYQDPIPQPRRSAYRVFARILVAQGKLDEASLLLDRLIEANERTGAFGSLVRVLTIKALVMDKLGNEIDALAVLDRALGLAEPERIMRPFLGVGEEMVPMLQKAAARRTTPKYTRELLLLLKADSGLAEALNDRDRGTGEDVSMDAQEWPVESLTKREMEVLRLLNTRLSVPEIAREMYVAPSTIRTHIRNIYSKLDVHSRFELVHRAKDLGLI